MLFIIWMIISEHFSLILWHSAIFVVCCGTTFRPMSFHVIYLCEHYACFPPFGRVAQFCSHCGIYSLSTFALAAFFSTLCPSQYFALFPFCCLLHFLAPTSQFCEPILGPLFNPFGAWGSSLWELFTHEHSFFPRSIFHCATSAILVIRLLFTLAFLIFSLIHMVSFYSPSLEAKLMFLWVFYNTADNIFINFYVSIKR